MFLSNKHPHKSSQTITIDNVRNRSKTLNKPSIQTVKTTRNNETKGYDHRLNTEPHKWDATVPFQD